MRHLAHIRTHIAEHNPTAAREVSATILAAVARLTRQPGLGRPGRVAGTRELVIPGTPYLVPYRVRGERLEIVAVFHGHQQWSEKL